MSVIFRLDDSFELSDSFREVADPTSNGECTTAVTPPRGRHSTLCEIRKEGAEIVRLLELAVADLDEMVEIGSDSREELAG